MIRSALTTTANGFGDFQTPQALAAKILAALRGRGAVPTRVLEPTCGSGAFLRAASAAFPQAEIIGIEYQRERYASALDCVCVSSPGVSVHYANAYELDFQTLPWRTGGPLLIVGNPPWITAAALGRSAGPVLQPPRSNPKALRGLAARTGAANFDVAEFLVLKLLRDLQGEPLELALLVKESVARNVLCAAVDLGLDVVGAHIVRIDARAWFGVAVNACCLFLTTRPHTGDHTANRTLTLFAVDGPPCGAQHAGRRAERDREHIGVDRVPVHQDFGEPPCSWFAATRRRNATPSIVFRQGIKHDAADVFELRRVDNVWLNGYGAVVDVEATHLFTLLKAGALHKGTDAGLTALIVPQIRLGAATAVLEEQAPRLWKYLCAHAQRIAARKSSIYRNAPPFAIFGIGPYSFAPWKVAVAGFYPEARFRVIGPNQGRPIMVGDTSYFAPFEHEADARAFGALCASPAVAAALAARVIAGKRPITKAILDDIDWLQISTTFESLPDSLRAILGERAGV